MKLSNWFTKAGIATRIRLAVLVPAAGLLIIVIALGVTRWQTVERLTHLTLLTETAPAIGRLVHELQRERGESGGFIDSDGELFSRKLQAQRSLTDERLKQLRIATEGLDLDRFGEHFSSRVRGFLSALDDLPDARRELDLRLSDYRKVISLYGGIIHNLLMIIEEMSILSTDAVLTRSIYSYNIFMQGKDLAGRERALGTIGFIDGGFSDEEFRAFVSLRAVQEFVFDQFRMYATPELEAFYRETSASAEDGELQALRLMLLRRESPADAGSALPLRWFDLSSTRADRLKIVEDAIENSLRNLTADIRNSATEELYALYLSSALLLLLTLLLASAIIRSITRPLGALIRGMLDLAGGDSGVRIHGLERKDEIGAMARAVAVFETSAIALHNLNRRMELATDSAGIGVWDWDLTANKLAWDDGMYRLYGITAESFANSYEAWQECVHPDDFSRVIKEVETATGGGKSFDTEFRVRWPDGETRYIKAAAQVICDAAGAPVRMTGINLDVTERERAQQDSRTLQQRLQNTVDNVRAAIFLKETDGRYVLVNSAFEEISGLSREAVIGRCEDEICSGEEAREVIREDRQILNTGTSRSHYLRKSADDGEVRDYLVQKTPIRDAGGRIVGIVGVSTDISEVKRAQEQVTRAKEQAEAANRAKSVFLANMSHEIRTPMNAILGYAQLMQRDSSLSGEHHQILETVNRSGAHLLGLINDILDMSKIEAGKMELVEQEFDLQVLLNDLRQMFVIRTDRQGIALSVDPLTDLPAQVKSDQSKLRQILINLLGNAVKFTRQGSITLRHRLLKQESEVITAEFVVEDSGVGIEGDRIERIFNLFEQTEKGMHAGGTGLGLAISRRMARKMGGDLVARSEPDKGSRFILTVQLKASQNPVAEQRVSRIATALEKGSDKPLILVVDDNDINRDVLVRLLRPLGFSLLEAVDGLEAVRLFEQHRPQLVLMDVVMPRMDGVEATRRIRELTGGSGPVILAVTASALEEEVARIKAGGADQVLSKPVEFGQLFQAMEAHTGIRFVYAEESGSRSGTLSDVVCRNAQQLPEELKSNILACLDIGDTGALRKQLDQVHSVDRKLGEYLVELLAGYELDAIRRLLGTEQSKAS